MDYTPTNIIDTPDFGRLAQGAMSQKRREIAETNKFIDDREKVRGAYLEGDKPAVQEAWNRYQSSLDAMVENDSPESKRAANLAYGDYVEVAGAARSLAGQYRKEVAAYKTDPTKFDLSSGDFLESTNEYRLMKRSADDIMSSINEPFMLPRYDRYQLSNPMDQAGKMLSMSRAKLEDFRNTDGTIDQSKLRPYARDLARSVVFANDLTLEQAMAWGGVREGYAGEDGILQSTEELERLRSQPDEKRDEFIESYVKELTKDYILLVGKSPRGLGGYRGPGNRGYLSLEQYQVGMPTSDPETPQSVTFRAFAKPLTGSMKNIVGFGENKLGEFLVQEVYQVDTYVNGKKTKENKRRVRKAEPNEIAQIKAALKKDYGLVVSEESVSSQEESADQGMTDAEYQQFLKDNGLNG